MTYSLTFELPGVPKSLNVCLRMHFRKRHEYTMYWMRMVEKLTRGRGPKEPLTSAQLTFTRYAPRFLDWDGAVGSLKPVCDALVQCRILQDDNYNVLKDWKVVQEYAPKKEERIRVEVFGEIAPDEQNLKSQRIKTKLKGVAA